MRSEHLALAALLFGGGCQSTRADLEGLAELEPLPYSVLVTGGAFELPDAEDADGSPLQHTFRSPGGVGEAIPLSDLVEVLRAARVFVDVAEDTGPEENRRLIADLGGPVPADDLRLQELLRTARERGHDLLLVVQRLQDGPVEEQGINGSWPLTISVWFLLGLGMFIPDHTFESRANLDVSLRDLQTGRVLYDTVRNAGPVDLALVERGSLWGIIGSIIIPPFWVPNDEEVAVESVREVSARRLLVSLARQLKGADAVQGLENRSAARIVATPGQDSLAVEVEVPAPESLAAMRLRVDAVLQRGPTFDAFEADLLAGPQQDAAGVLKYEATYPFKLDGQLLQVLVQTTSGRVASETVRLR